MTDAPDVGGSLLFHDPNSDEGDDEALLTLLAAWGSNGSYANRVNAVDALIDDANDGNPI